MRSSILIRQLQVTQPALVHQAKRKAEWKRRQGGQAFLDHLIVNVRGGKGGDGCVAFHREKFHAKGPPSGGNGGPGGSVYFVTDESMNSLAGISKRLRGANGGNGMGGWMHGKRGEDLVVRVPVGTVVRERKEKVVETEEEEDDEEDRRAKRWVHYPLYKSSNESSEAFLEAEEAMKRDVQERRRRRQQWLEQTTEEPLYLDLNTPMSPDEPGVLIARGGRGGYGNPHFLTASNRSPKFATKGHEGFRITLDLELKLLADVGFVGLPNAGKSTLLKALTGSKTEIAGYEFTTLNPQIGIVKVWEEGGFGDEDGDGIVEESAIERGLGLSEGREMGEERRKWKRGDRIERTRFTIADNPGLLEGASENFGLGHSFLRSIERSLALAYVVDLSSSHPWNDLDILRGELEAYQEGLSDRARIVIATKADLIVDGGEGRDKVRRIEEYVRNWMGGGQQGHLDVIPVSGKMRGNLESVVMALERYVQEERERIRREAETNEEEPGGW